MTFEPLIVSGWSWLKLYCIERKLVKVGW